MMEPSLEMMQHAFSCTTDMFEELRIIAKDAHGLSSADREVIRHGADELEYCLKLLIATMAELDESNARRIAINEQLIEARRPPAPAPKLLSLSISTGWRQLQLRTWP
jgi:hypothetical protein